MRAAREKANPRDRRAAHEARRRGTHDAALRRIAALEHAELSSSSAGSDDASADGGDSAHDKPSRRAEVKAAKRAYYKAVGNKKGNKQKHLRQLAHHRDVATPDFGDAPPGAPETFEPSPAVGGDGLGRLWPKSKFTLAIEAEVAAAKPVPLLDPPFHVPPLVTPAAAEEISFAAAAGGNVVAGMVGSFGDGPCCRCCAPCTEARDVRINSSWDRWHGIICRACVAEQSLPCDPCVHCGAPSVPARPSSNETRGYRFDYDDVAGDASAAFCALFTDDDTGRSRYEMERWWRDAHRCWDCGAALCPACALVLSSRMRMHQPEQLRHHYVTAGGKAFVASLALRVCDPCARSRFTPPPVRRALVLAPALQLSNVLRHPTVRRLAVRWWHRGHAPADEPSTSSFHLQAIDDAAAVAALLAGLDAAFPDEQPGVHGGLGVMVLAAAAPAWYPTALSSGRVTGSTRLMMQPDVARATTALPSRRGKDHVRRLDIHRQLRTSAAATRAAVAQLCQGTKAGAAPGAASARAAGTTPPPPAHRRPPAAGRRGHGVPRNRVHPPGPPPPPPKLPQHAMAVALGAAAAVRRSEERRVGKECLRQCRSRWSPYH